jgi:hypothetical protein
MGEPVRESTTLQGEGMEANSFPKTLPCDAFKLC